MFYLPEMEKECYLCCNEFLEYQTNNQSTSASYQAVENVILKFLPHFKW